MNIFTAELFGRELQKLKDELNNFKDERNMWKTTNGVSNSAGNLSLHLIGNLNHFIGNTLGNTGYVRNRDAEFTTKEVPRAMLITEIDKVSEVVKNVLSNMTDTELEKDFPFEMFGKRSTAFYLAHFYGHITYHLGQINYLRRFLEN